MAPQGPIGPRFDLTNQRFGRLVALNHVSYKRNGKWVLAWRCRCNCGNEHTVSAIRLRFGDVKSCGCLKIDTAIKNGHANRKHGEARPGAQTIEYRTWVRMRSRCRDKNNSAYRFYGGRGLTVCKRWDRYENFLKDMGRRPDERYSLDRIDNDKGYSPANCRWATDSEQNVNRRMTHKRLTSMHKNLATTRSHRRRRVRLLRV